VKNNLKKTLLNNYVVHFFQVSWPLLVAMIITFFHSKKDYTDLAILMNTGYFIGGLFDYGGVNHRILYLSKNSKWWSILLLKIIISSILFFFFDFVKVLFAISVFLNPLWIYTDCLKQSSFVNYSLLLKFISLPLLFLSNFIIPFSIAQVIIFLILNLIVFKDLNKSFELKQSNIFLGYLTTGFSFFISKISTSFWLYIPLVLFSSIGLANENIAYFDKVYQLFLLSTVPITLTFLKSNNTDFIFNSIKKYIPYVFIFLIVNFLTRNLIGHQISSYINLTIGMMFISFFGHGFAVNDKQINFQNYSIFIFTVISSVILYLNLDFYYYIIFMNIFLNMLLRTYILRKI